MFTHQSTLGWKTIAITIVVAITATVLFATFFPWFAVLTGLTLLGSGIAYAAWPPVSKKIAALVHFRNPSLRNRIYFGAPVALYAVILLFLSQSQIRANWRVAETRAEVARELEYATSALDREEVQEALAICSRLESKANRNEKNAIAAVRTRAQDIEQSHRIKDANIKVLQWVSEGRLHVLKRELDKAESDLESALHVPLATEFSHATEFSNEIVAARTKLAKQFLDEGELELASEEARRAVAVTSATATAERKQFLVDICNRHVAQLVVLAREALANMNRDEAAVLLERALAIRDAAETAEAQKMMAEIRGARESEANERVSSIIADAQQLLDEKRFDEAVRTLNAALAVPHSTQKAQVTAALQRIQKEQAAERDREIAIAKAEKERKAADAERQRKAEAAAVAARKAEEEYEKDGLVLLRKTVKGTTGEFGGEITGSVVNRRKRELTYVQISFKLFDASGAQVGTAVDNINHLEAGGTWKFKATSFGTQYSSYKIGDLSGF